MISWKKTLLTVVAVGCTLSCVRQPNLEDENVPASVTDVQDALISAWGFPSPLTMKKGDFLYQETDQKIETDVARVTLQEGVTVFDVTEPADHPDDYLYNFVYQTKVIKNNEEQTSSRNYQVYVSKKEDMALAVAQSVLKPQSLVKPDLQTMSDDLHLTFGISRVEALAYACQKTPELDKYCKETLKVDSCRVQCSNLKVTDETRPAPDLMKAQANCAGLPNCSLKIKKVSFDWSIILTVGSTSETQKVNYNVALSPDLPFLSRLVDYCSRGLYQVSSAQKVLVTTCTRMKNHVKGGG